MKNLFGDCAVRWTSNKGRRPFEVVFSVKETSMPHRRNSEMQKLYIMKCCKLSSSNIV